MTYKNVARQSHFRDQTGSSSVRIVSRGHGGHGTFGDPMEILPSVKEQYETLKARVKVISAALESRPPASERERLRQELASKIQHVGNMRRLLQEGSRLAFEAIFVNVASYKLPRDTFEKLQQEAREIWRSDGYVDFVPEPTKAERRRSAKRAAYKAVAFK